MKARWLLFNMSVLFIVGMLISSAYAKIDPKTVVGMWLFDEGEGEIAKDSSGNAGDVELQNGTAWVDGKFGKALGFDGADDVASASVPNAPQGAAVRTIMGWAKSNNAASFSGVVAYGNPVAANSVFGFLQGNGIWYSQLWGAAPAADLPTSAKADTLLHHHAVVYDGKNLIHYYDGEEVANAARNPVTVGTTLIIGSEVDGDAWFNGFVDEVALFDVILTQEDINNIMTKGLEIVSAVSSTGKLTTAWGRIKAQD